MSDQEKHLDHGKIIERIDRPSKNLIAKFAKHDTAKVADSMAGQGVMDYEIKPLAPEMRIVGTALTVLTRPGDALFVQKAIDLTQPGDVIVIDGGGFKNVCVIGERLGYFYKLKGAVGIVVDGAVRDSQGMIDGSPPTFARSVCIKIFGSTGPGAINVPVQCGGVLVHPGDIVIGDRDGVVVIPKEDASRVLDLADKHLENELARLKRVEAGESVTEVFALEPKIAKWIR
jgi:4-hydroxy-4-methyl-2-oxoglutarate aldolase